MDLIEKILLKIVGILSIPGMLLGIWILTKFGADIKWQIRDCEIELLE